jgi:AcrR family transcriptional regulator
MSNGRRNGARSEGGAEQAGEPAKSARMSADERRALVLEAATAEFAMNGLHGTSAETIARRAGISQPYLFRLFGTKKELFLAVVDLGFDRVLAAVRQAAEATTDGNLLGDMADAYSQSLSENEGFLAQMQFYAACGDDEVRFAVRRRFAELFRFVEQVSRAGEEDVRAFFANTLLQSVAAAMRLPELAARETWARRVTGGGG